MRLSLLRPLPSPGDFPPLPARRAATAVFAAGVVATGALLAGCGPSAEERLAAQTAAVVEPVIAAFTADLDAGRVEQARARGTTAFQSAATPDAIRVVVQGQAGVLGRLLGRDPAAVVKLDSTETSQGPVARAVLLSVPARFEKGNARIETRLERGASDGAWRIDTWSVKADLFEWSLR